MATFNSQPYQYGEFISQYPVELIGKSLLYKQEKYDANRQKLQDFYNRMNMTDFYKKEDREYFQQRLSVLSEEVNKAGAGDLSIAANLDGITGHLSQATDERVINGYLGTQQIRQYQQEFEKLREKDPKNYNDLNYQYGLVNAQKWSQDGKSGTRLDSYKDARIGAGIGRVTPYRDTMKELQEAAEKISPDIQVVRTEQGIQFVDIYNQTVSDSRLRNLLEMKMQDSGFSEQMNINAWGQYRGMDDGTFKSYAKINLETQKTQLQEQLGTLQTEATKLTGAEKQKKDAEINMVSANMTAIQNRMVNLDVDLDKERALLERNMHAQELTNNFVNTYGYSQVKDIKYHTNEVKKIMLEHQNAKDLKAFSAKLDHENKIKELGLDAWMKRDLHGATSANMVLKMMSGGASTMLDRLIAEQTKLSPVPAETGTVSSAWELLNTQIKDLTQQVNSSSITPDNYDKKIKEATIKLNSIKDKNSDQFRLQKKAVDNMITWKENSVLLEDLMKEKKDYETGFTTAVSSNLNKGEAIRFDNGKEMFLDKSDNKIKLADKTTLKEAVKGDWNTGLLGNITREGATIFAALGGGISAIASKISSAVSGEGTESEGVVSRADRWGLAAQEALTFKDEKGQPIKTTWVDGVVSNIRRKSYVTNGNISKEELTQVIMNEAANSEDFQKQIIESYNMSNQNWGLINRTQQVTADASMSGFNLASEIATAGINLPTELKQSLAKYDDYQKVAPKFALNVFTDGNSKWVTYKPTEESEETVKVAIPNNLNTPTLTKMTEDVRKVQPTLRDETIIRRYFRNASESGVPQEIPIHSRKYNNIIGTFKFTVENGIPTARPDINEKAIGNVDFIPTETTYQKEPQESFYNFYNRIQRSLLNQLQ